MAVAPRKTKRKIGAMTDQSSTPELQRELAIYTAEPAADAPTQFLSNNPIGNV